MKPTVYRLLSLCAMVAAAAATQTACAGADPATAKNSAPRLLQEIKAEIGEAPCDSDAQCHSIGVGTKPCGGPEGHLAWSSKLSDRERLLDLVAQHREVRRIENERSDMRSDCRVTPDPGAACRPRVQDGQRTCQLLNARTANGRPGAP